jgi:murein L,D-transpeptidase YafK
MALTLAVAGAFVLSACAKIEISPSMMPLSKETMMLLGKKGMSVNSPVFVRIFKEESELEIWKLRDDGRFYHFKTYPICHWSGDLGPKVRQGDMQAPEGFYTIQQYQMNPNSQYHLAFNIGYPNAFDRANKRDGDFLMVHGKCKSAGCYAMTDGLIEEIYALAREGFIGGEDSFQVHAMPFRMTDANMARYTTNPNYKFWQTLKEGYDFFETYRVPPAVGVCERKYVVNASWRGGPLNKLNPEGACPPLDRPVLTPYVANPADKAAEERIVVQGPKTRNGIRPEPASATSASWSNGTGSTGLGFAFSK